MTWAVQYIGDPWIHGEHDCWGFFRRVQKEQFNIDLPIMDIDANNMLAVARSMKTSGEKSNWEEINTPVEGDAVLMAHAKYPSHIGVWVDADRGGVLHCVRGQGVVFSSRQNLDLTGWKHLTFYRRVKN